MEFNPAILEQSVGEAERRGFEYFRHGTLSLFAALNTQSGEVLGQTVLAAGIAVLYALLA